MSAMKAALNHKAMPWELAARTGDVHLAQLLCLLVFGFDPLCNKKDEGVVADAVVCLRAEIIEILNGLARGQASGHGRLGRS